jgi:LCP family protein required for cell wall assembly
LGEEITLEQRYINVSSKKGKRTAAPQSNHRRPVRKPWKRVFWTLYAIAVVISALIVAGYLIMTFFIKAPEQTKATTTPTQSTTNVQIAPVGDIEEVSTVQTGLVRREGVYNVLLAATDEDGYRTDTMMVLCYDIPNQTVGVVSVPRDTIVDREKGTDPRLVYGSGGVEQRVEDISTMLGVPIDYYVKVNIKGFIALVDYLDGVDFYVPCDMNYDDPIQNLHIHYSQGTQHLTGQQAMEVARFRKNNADSSGNSTGYSDVGRTQTQQKLLVALAKKLLSWGSLTKINGFVEIFNTYVDTDLSLTDMLYFASQAVNCDLSNVETATLEGRGDGVYHGKSWCYELDAEQTLETVNRLINPYEQELTLDDMHLVSADKYMS